MKRRVKSPAASLLLTCFLILTFAQFVRPLAAVSFNPRRALAADCFKLTRHVVEEVGGAVPDLRPLADFTASEVNPVSASAAMCVPLRDRGLEPFSLRAALMHRRTSPSPAADDNCSAAVTSL